MLQTKEIVFCFASYYIFLSFTFISSMHEELVEFIMLFLLSLQLSLTLPELSF